MKILFWLTPLTCLLCACHNAQPRQKAEPIQHQENASARDLSINPSNSYSDLFLDSMAMEKFIAAKKIPGSLAVMIRNFYDHRNYQYAWFNSDGLTPEARGFWNLHDYATTYGKDSSLKDKSLQKEMDALTTEDTLNVTAREKKITHTEFMLTLHFIKYISGRDKKNILPQNIPGYFIPTKKENVLALADSVIGNRRFEEKNTSYFALVDQLATYYTLAKNGGWPRIRVRKVVLKKGVSSPEVVAFKKRLRATGDLAVEDSSKIFDTNLKKAVESFQQRHGYTPTGIITRNLVKEMNITVTKRMEQILVNLDRMKWIMQVPEQNLIVVNIPEFVLHAYRKNRKVFDMEVIVGKEGHSTVMFNGNLNEVVFSPYWNIPADIVKNEILPDIKQDKKYLAIHDMEVTGSEDGLPVIRQRPGKKNALGKVKFLFPNNFNIYLHDTPAKSLFEKNTRAYSHGCIRVKDPEKLALFVLGNQSGWTPLKIEKAMNSGHEKFVRVEDPIPVMITYYTAWVDDNGKLNFRDDIYGHDRDLEKELFL